MSTPSIDTRLESQIDELLDQMLEAKDWLRGAETASDVRTGDVLMKSTLDSFHLNFEPLPTDRKIILHKPDSIWLQIIDGIEYRVLLGLVMALLALKRYN